jgi:hypothetical protein
MKKKFPAFVFLSVVLLMIQPEATFAKRIKQKHPKAISTETLKSDPTPVESISIAPAGSHLASSMIPDLGCNAGSLKVDFGAKTFNFAANLPSLQSTSMDPVP